MSKTLIGCGLAVLGLVVLVVVMITGVYNNLVGLQEGVDGAWGQVENVYQRRADLIPNLVATVKGAADFEQEVLVVAGKPPARRNLVPEGPAGPVGSSRG